MVNNLLLRLYVLLDGSFGGVPKIPMNPVPFLEFHEFSQRVSASNIGSRKCDR